MRRTRAHVDTGVFDPAALRAEDTLLLANLIQNGKLPLFVPEAIVEHAIPLSLMKCFWKDVRSVYLEGKAYNIIASKGVRIRVTHRERLRLLSAMWKTAGQPSIGRSAWFVLVARQTRWVCLSDVAAAFAQARLFVSVGAQSRNSCEFQGRNRGVAVPESVRILV
jgi:hypothetical protein